jgi:hypothetical protein
VCGTYASVVGGGEGEGEGRGEGEAGGVGEDLGDDWEEAAGDEAAGDEAASGEAAGDEAAAEPVSEGASDDMPGSGDGNSTSAVLVFGSADATGGAAGCNAGARDKLGEPPGLLLTGEAPFATGGLREEVPSATESRLRFPAVGLANGDTAADCDRTSEVVVPPAVLSLTRSPPLLWLRRRDAVRRGAGVSSGKYSRISASDSRRRFDMRSACRACSLSLAASVKSASGCRCFPCCVKKRGDGV